MERRKGAKRKSVKAAGAGEILPVLAARFRADRSPPPGVSWAAVEARLAAAPAKVRALEEMERTGGEPALVGVDGRTGEFLFCDCAEESPAGRRSLCYDGAALAARRAHRPAGSAMDMAAAMGVELLTEERYRDLQRRAPLDRKTSSWILTPPDIRAEGGALFGDRRFGHVFVYHNGAESYYAARGFRGCLRV